MTGGDNLITDFLLTERQVDAVEDDEADEDDDPDCPIKTAGEALKWTCHLKHYVFNKGLTKNHDTTVLLESDLEEVISSSALTKEQTTIT